MDKLVRLDTVKFDELRNTLGLSEDSQMAEYIGVSRTSIWRIKNGKMYPGGDFIAKVLKSFPELRFEDIFFVA